MQFDIRRLDIYRKIPKDLTQPTLTGAAVSIFSVLFITFLFISELLLFLSIDVASELTVDDPVQHAEKIPVFINISLPKMACEYVGLDIQDEMGRHEVGFHENTQKIPLTDNGCRFECHFLINKVPGNFHVSTHAAKKQPPSPDMSHIVHEVRFGMELEVGKTVKGSFNPLMKAERLTGNRKCTLRVAKKKISMPLSTHDYIVRIVPTVYEDIRNNIRYPYQYTFSYRDVLQHGHGGRVMPAIWFRYELSPITVKYHEQRKPFYTFLTTEELIVDDDFDPDDPDMPVVWFSYDISPITVRYREYRKPFYTFITTVCAIIGGTFTVAGIIDSCLFTAAEIFKKAELGKLS